MRKVLIALFCIPVFCGAAFGEVLDPDKFCMHQVNSSGYSLYSCNNHSSYCVNLFQNAPSGSNNGTFADIILNNAIPETTMGSNNCYICTSNGFISIVNGGALFDISTCANNGSTRQSCKKYTITAIYSTSCSVSITTAYQCRAGYYGTEANANNDACTSCTATCGAGTTSSNGATSHTNCYDTRSSITDDYGTYNWNGNICYCSNS